MPSINDLLDYPDHYVRESDDESLKMSNLDNYEEIVENLSEMCRYELNAQETSIHFFGSTVIGLAHESSDLDIFIDVGEKFFI